MATTKRVVEGMSIIASKMDADEYEGHSVYIDSYQIYCGEYRPDKMSEEELKTLDKLGWFEEEDSWCILL